MLKIYHSATSVPIYSIMLAILTRKDDKSTEISERPILHFFFHEYVPNAT